MAMLIKAKPKAAEAIAPQTDSDDGNPGLKSLLEQYLQLEAQLDDISAQVKKINAPVAGLKKMLEECVRDIKLQFPELETMAPDATLEKVVEGHFVKIGTAGMTRHVHDLPALREKLGDEAFMMLASIKLGDIDKYVAKEEQGAYVTTSYDPEKRNVSVEPMPGTVKKVTKT